MVEEKTDITNLKNNWMSGNRQNRPENLESKIDSVVDKQRSMAMYTTESIKASGNGNPR